MAERHDEPAGEQRTAPLHGMRVVITRPSHQAEPLCRAIERAGGEPVRFPALTIAPPTDPETARRALEALREVDWLVFVSANAVQGARELVGEALTRSPARFAAVGEGTARSLAALGRPADLVPREGAGSEGLLAMPELAAERVSGARVLIVRGEGGRELLAETLRERGAGVDYAEVYRRARPAVEDSGALRAAWLEPRRPDAVVATSPAILDNLVTMLAGSSAEAVLLGTRLVVVSERMMRAARAHRFEREPVIAEGPDEGAVVDALARVRALDASGPGSDANGISDGTSGSPAP